MKRPHFLSAWLLLSLAFLPMGCSNDEDETYPSIITEFADMKSNEKGTMVSFTTDDGQTYQIANLLEGFVPMALFRVVCGFVPEGQKAKVYQLQGAHLLRDSLSCQQHDPTGVISAWRRGPYINLHLAPLTQGETQYWGFITDSIHPRHPYLSLHHRQANDPLSYTKDVYATIPLDSIAGYEATDTITLIIETFKGSKRYDFKP